MNEESSSSNHNSNARPVSLPREVRDTLRSAVMDASGHNSDADGRMFDLALDEASNCSSN